MLFSKKLKKLFENLKIGVNDVEVENYKKNVKKTKIKGNGNQVAENINNINPFGVTVGCERDHHCGSGFSISVGPQEEKDEKDEE